MISPSLRQQIESTFEVVRHRCSQDELAIVCPEPGCGDKSGNRGINLSSGRTNCWRCNKGGDFVAWARRLGYLFDSSSTSGVSVEALLPQAHRPGLFLPPVRRARMPAGFTALAREPKSVYARLIGEMAVRKNLTLKDFMDVGAGFTRTDEVWEPYCIFPVTEYQLPVYYQGRIYAETEPGQRTKRFPARDQLSYGSRYWLYNIDEFLAQEAPIVIVVESILNVLSLRKKLAQERVSGVVPVAAFKHSLSREQAAKLVRCPHLKEICLLYDHDAIAASWQSAPRLSARVSIARMPAGPDNRRLDPNDDVDAAWQAFCERQEFSKLSNLAWLESYAQQILGSPQVRRLGRIKLEVSSKRVENGVL